MKERGPLNTKEHGPLNMKERGPLNVKECVPLNMKEHGPLNMKECGPLNMKERDDSVTYDSNAPCKTKKKKCQNAHDRFRTLHEK
ncbi:hypothetical protein BgiMline_014119, partial [Biomphalaria glabrata]